MSLPKPKRILKGRKIEGVIVCRHPKQEEREKEIEVQREEEQLKSLEIFWENKGFQLGYEKGLKEGKKEGEREGYEVGFQKGKEEGEKKRQERDRAIGFESGERCVYEKIQTLVDSLEKLQWKWIVLRESVTESIKEEWIHFSLQVCEKVLCQSIHSPSFFLPLLQQLFEQNKKAVRDQSVTVFLSSLDFSCLEECFSLFNASEYQIKEFKWSIDDQLEAGNFRIDMPSCLLNFDIQRQVNELYALCFNSSSELNASQGDILNSN